MIMIVINSTARNLCASRCREHFAGRTENEGQSLRDISDAMQVFLYLRDFPS